jgi:predicted nuclease of restriction endonuclease-like (RecB) superfamily
MRREFPGQSGWSTTNLKYMRMFAQAFPDPDAIGQQLAGQLPWGHVRLLLDKAKTAEERAWHARAAVEMGRSRNVMLCSQKGERTRALSARCQTFIA